MKYILSITLLIIFLSFTSNTQVRDTTPISKILRLRELANKSEIDILKRFEYAREAITLSNQYGNDSTILESNRILSWLFIISNQYDSLYRVNKENLKIASKIKDSIKMAYAYNNLGFYYSQININDSAYYYYNNARKFYELLKDIQNESHTILNMANIQESERDYIGAEINAIKGIEITKTLPV